MKKSLIIFCFLLLSGCTVKILYKNIDWLAYWYIDDYIEFTDKQEVVFDKELTRWLRWHQEKELPLYLSHLHEVTADISKQQLDFDRLSYHQQKFLDHWIRLKTKMVPGLVSIAVLLSDSQVEELFNAIDEKNIELSEELAERLDKSAKKQKKIALKKRTKNIERWLGKMTSQQKKLIADNYGQYHANRALWLAYRARYQVAVRALFDQADRSEKFQLALTALILFPESYKEEELTQRNDENAVIFKTFLLNIEATLSDKQRKHLIDEIGDYSEDIGDILG